MNNVERARLRLVAGNDRVRTALSEALRKRGTSDILHSIDGLKAVARAVGDTDLEIIGLLASAMICEIGAQQITD